MWTIGLSSSTRPKASRARLVRPEKALGCRGSVQSQVLEGDGEEAAARVRRTENLAGLGGGTSEARESTRCSPHTRSVLLRASQSVLRGCNYTHFTEYHGGAEVSDLLKISQFLSDSWDSNADLCSRAIPRPSPFSRPHAASWRQQWAASQAGRAGKGSQGGANAGQVGRTAKSRELVTTE